MLPVGHETVTEVPLVAGVQVLVVSVQNWVLATPEPLSPGVRVTI